uniref:acyl carrier protein n=1 Tax=Candidatus Cryptobacteroides bacterium TaxID=3085639 RepID=UPI004025289C
MESIIFIVSDVLGVEVEKIAPESKLYHDLGADSFDFVTIISKCESLYRITITDEDRLNIITVKDLYDVVWDKIQHSI